MCAFGRGAQVVYSKGFAASRTPFVFAACKVAFDLEQYRPFSHAVGRFTHGGAAWTVQRNFEHTGDYPHTDAALLIVPLCPDKLGDIVRNWKPGKFTKSFLSHLVELVHTTLKTLEWYREGRTNHIGGIDGSSVSKKKTGGEVDKAVLDRVAAAKKFDFAHYFGKLATNA